MAMNPIQVQPGMSLTVLFEQYGTEAQCEQALEKAGWPSGFHCPSCNNAHHRQFYSDGTKHWQCSNAIVAVMRWFFMVSLPFCLNWQKAFFCLHFQISEEILNAS